MTYSSKNPWFHVPENPAPWLVDGLIPADSLSSIIGKPKSGKSTFIRSLVAHIVKSKPFLNRPINLPDGAGRVLYIHLDRKDPDWTVFRDLRECGITAEEAERVIIRTSEDMQAKGSEERLTWLQSEVNAAKPHLVVIDLLWQFVVAKNSNDYNAVLDGINTLQDKLKAIEYKGAVIVTMHGRKATSTTDPFDDALGSTSQRGSCSTNIMLSHPRLGPLKGQYTIISDQTERTKQWGEIPETQLIRNDDGTLSLGQSMDDLSYAAAVEEKATNKDRLCAFLEMNPGSTTDAITEALGISKKTFGLLVKGLEGYVYAEGKGIKNDPFLYFAHDPMREQSEESAEPAPEKARALKKSVKKKPSQAELVASITNPEAFAVTFNAAAEETAHA